MYLVILGSKYFEDSATYFEYLHAVCHISGGDSSDATLTVNCVVMFDIWSDSSDYYYVGILVTSFIYHWWYIYIYIDIHKKLSQKIEECCVIINLTDIQKKVPDI